LREFLVTDDVGNTDEMAENALKILKDNTTFKILKKMLSVAKV
jgi:hypothetical protein